MTERPDGRPPPWPSPTPEQQARQRWLASTARPSAPRPGRPSTWASAAGWCSLVVAVVLIAVAGSGGYLGECSYETGYYPEVGVMRFVPLLVLGVGLVEVVGAGLARRHRPNRALIMGGLALCASSVVSIFLVVTAEQAQACD